jgi:hypothetical protein
MKQAVGTSLFIIFINSLIGFIGELGVCQTGPQSSIDYYSNGNARRLSEPNYQKKIDGAKLKPAFEWFVLLWDSILLPKKFF